MIKQLKEKEVMKIEYPQDEMVTSECFRFKFIINVMADSYVDTEIH
jgi:hypothetical protein